MKSIKIAGLCLVAALALSALASASASAKPTLKVCAKAAKEPKGSEHKYNGSFKNKSCTEAEVGGKYVLKEIPTGTKYTGKSKTSRIRFKNKEGKTVTVTCKKDGLELETSSSESFGGTLTLDGCSNESKQACTVTTMLFNAPLVSFTAKEEAPFGLALVALFTINCGGEQTELYGYLAGAAENTSKGVTLNYNLTGGGQQEVQDFYYQGKNWTESGEPTHLVKIVNEAFTTEEATFEGKEEIKAKGVKIEG